jgi:RNA polymerase sigma-70 factor (ECF subfamily)
VDFSAEQPAFDLKGRPRLAAQREWYTARSVRPLLVENHSVPSAPVPVAPLPVSFEEVYRLEFKPVWRAMACLGVPAAHVEDLVHDVFVTAYRKWAEYDPTRPARAWLLGIATRKASDHRALHRHHYEIADEQAAAHVAAPAISTDSRDAKKIVEAALAQMAEGPRAVFVLHELEQRPIPEVAGLLNIPVATAYTRLRAARLKFKEAVTPHAEEIR